MIFVDFFFHVKPVNLHKSPNPLAGLSIKKPVVVADSHGKHSPRSSGLQPRESNHPPGEILGHVPKLERPVGDAEPLFLGDVWTGKFHTGKVCLVAPPLYV